MVLSPSPDPKRSPVIMLDWDLEGEDMAKKSNSLEQAIKIISIYQHPLLLMEYNIHHS
jgi:hypothetical protein